MSLLENIGFKQFRRQARFSHVVFHRTTREALVLDPSLEVFEDIRDFLFSNGLKPVVVLETSDTPDSSASAFFKEFSIPRNPTEFKRWDSFDIRAFFGKNFGILDFGKFAFLSKHCSEWESAKEELSRFLNESDPHSVLFHAHDSRERVCSLAKVEKQRLLAEPRPGAVGAIAVEKYSQKLRAPSKDGVYVDVREADEYFSEHMKGEVVPKNVPLAEIGFYYEFFLKGNPIYLSCLSGRRSGWAAQTVTEWVDSSVEVVNVTGGIKAWIQAGLPVIEGEK